MICDAMAFIDMIRILGQRAVSMWCSENSPPPPKLWRKPLHASPSAPMTAITGAPGLEHLRRDRLDKTAERDARCGGGGGGGDRGGVRRSTRCFSIPASQKSTRCFSTLASLLMWGGLHPRSSTSGSSSIMIINASTVDAAP